MSEPEDCESLNMHKGEPIPCKRPGWFVGLVVPRGGLGWVCAAHARPEEIEAGMRDLDRRVRALGKLVGEVRKAASAAEHVPYNAGNQGQDVRSV